jgi:hypothetical protein
MIAALNDMEVLGDTPIGFLRVVEWGDGAAVAIMHDDDRSKVKRIIHQLEPGENPLNAVYGKRLREQRQVAKLIEQADETRKARLEGKKADNKKDFVKEVERFLNKHWDGSGREAIAQAVRWRDK